jgi:PAS domain S-box-containing protein
LAAIVESSDDAIVSKNLDGIIQSWNTGAERIFGYRAHEVIGKSIILLIPPERRAEERMILDRIRRGQRVEHYETVRMRKDGTLLDISLTVSPVKDANGKVIGASKIARNITDRKRMESIQRALYNFITTVNRTGDFQTVANAAIDAILTCQHADRAAILVRSSGNTMRFAAWRGISTAYRLSVERYSPWKESAFLPQPVMIADVPSGLEEPERSAVQREGIRALAFVPITFEKRLLGRLGVFYNMPHPFTCEEMRPTETIAAQLAFVLERQSVGVHVN